MNIPAPDFSRAPRCLGRALNRRDFLQYSAAALVAPAVLGRLSLSASGPHPVPRALTSIGLCKRYVFAEVRRVLAHSFDELGDVQRLVRRKHVLVKTNLVNTSEEDVAGVPLALTVTVHPIVALALGSLLVKYGARSVTFCDQLPFRTPDAEAFEGYGFKLTDFNQAMDGRARFENTRNLGRHKSYAWVKVPNGELATAWEVNRSYVETDVIVSLAKLKSHVSNGTTGGMKNLFGVPPSSLYGEDLEGHPDENAISYRGATMHSCTKKPLTSGTSFTGKTVEGDHGYNVPRFVVDLAAAFPISLVVIDGISTIQTAEGWWNGAMVSVTRPGLLIAGRNPVCTDAVAAAVMGFDPDAPDRTWPFANGANHLAIARRRGLGENRLSELEIAGVPIEQARCEYQPTYQRIGS